MAQLRSSTTIGGNLVWHTGNLRLDPQGDTITYNGFTLYSEHDKPTSQDVKAINIQGDIFYGAINRDGNGIAVGTTRSTTQGLGFTSNVTELFGGSNGRVSLHDSSSKANTLTISSNSTNSTKNVYVTAAQSTTANALTRLDYVESRLAESQYESHAEFFTLDSTARNVLSCYLVCPSAERHALQSDAYNVVGRFFAYTSAGSRYCSENIQINANVNNNTDDVVAVSSTQTSNFRLAYVDYDGEPWIALVGFGASEEANIEFVGWTKYVDVTTSDIRFSSEADFRNSFMTKVDFYNTSSSSVLNSEVYNSIEYINDAIQSDGNGGQYFTDNYHPNADKLTTPRTLTTTLTGDVTGSASVSFDGSANRTTTITAVVQDDSHTHEFDNLTDKESGTGNYKTTGDMAGNTLTTTSGELKLTENASVVFNETSKSIDFVFNV